MPVQELRFCADILKLVLIINAHYVAVVFAVHAVRPLRERQRLVVLRLESLRIAVRPVDRPGRKAVGDAPPVSTTVLESS